MTELTPYGLVLFAHVLAGVVLVGESIVAPHIRRGILAARTHQELRNWMDVMRGAARLNPLAALTLLGTGIYMGSRGWWSQGWFHVAVLAWVVNAALAIAVVKRTAAGLGQAAAAAGEGPVSAEIDARRRSTAWAAASGALLANNLVLLFVMMAKPTGLLAAGLFVGANAVLLAVRAVRRPAAEVPAPA